MLKITILAGGDSDERAVSLRSGAAVAEALTSSGYAVTLLDPARTTTDYMATILDADVVFPVLHGTGGEDGSIQAWLESQQVSYVGADAAASQTCFNKHEYKQKLRQHGIRVPHGDLVDRAGFLSHELINTPFVLKPNDGGSSVDTFVVRDPAAADLTALCDAFSRHRHMLLEELISGTEITVGVLIDRALPVIEIVPPPDGEFDYNNKYNGKTLELCPPQSVDAAIQTAARDLAWNIHTITSVRDISRTDMIVDQAGKLCVLETNTIPGMTTRSLLPKAAAAAGYTMPALCDALVHAALTRRTLARTDQTGSV